MTLDDLLTFFKTTIAKCDTEPKQFVPLIKMFETYINNECINKLSIKFPDTNNPNLKSVLEKFFIQTTDNPQSSINSYYLCWAEFNTELKQVKEVKDQPIAEFYKDHILDKISTFAKEWGQIQSQVLADKIYSGKDNGIGKDRTGGIDYFYGGQVTYISGNSTVTTAEDQLQKLVENCYFRAIWEWMGWMLNPGLGAPPPWTNWTTLFNGNNVPVSPAASQITISSISPGSYKIIELKDDLTAFKVAVGGDAFLWNTTLKPPQTVDKQIPNNTPITCYTIHDLPSYLGAIREIGMLKSTNTEAKLIRIVANTDWPNLGNQQTQIDFDNNNQPVTPPKQGRPPRRGKLQDNATYIFLSRDNQYAYPFRIYGKHVADLWASGKSDLPYKDTYSDLLDFGRDTMKTPQYAKNFIAGGAFLDGHQGSLVPQIIGNNYASASNNATMSYALNTITLLSANYISECCRNWAQLLLGIVQLGDNGATYLDSKYFPMIGGSWSGAWSWGNQLNPRATKAGVLVGTARWFLNIFFANSIGDKPPTSNGFLVNNKNDVASNIAKTILNRPTFAGTPPAINPPDLDAIFNNAVKGKFKEAVLEILK